MAVFIWVWFQGTLVHAYVVDCKALRLPAVFYYFLCPPPLSTGNMSTTEANLMSINILEVASVPFSFCRKFKWAIIIRAIQVSDAPSNFPCSYQVFPFQRMHLEVPQVLAFLNPFFWQTYNLVYFQSFINFRWTSLLFSCVVCSRICMFPFGPFWYTVRFNLTALVAAIIITSSTLSQ